jgi:hypothetical protein
MRLHSIVVVLLLGVTAFSMAPIAHLGSAPRAVVASGPPGPPIFSANASWNGHPAAPATTAANAIPTSFGAPVTIQFRWGCTMFTGCGYGITHAVLHVLYLGQVVWTKDQAFSPATPAFEGEYNLTSDLTASKYLVEGLFLVQAILLTNADGASWSQSFYVHVAATDHLTVATVGLGVLAAYEVASLLLVGPHGLPKRPKHSEAPPTSPPEGRS